MTGCKASKKDPNSLLIYSSGKHIKKRQRSMMSFWNILRKNLNPWRRKFLQYVRNWLLYKSIPSKSVCKIARGGYKNSKDRVSIMLFFNITGPIKHKTILIGKIKKPRCFKKFIGIISVNYIFQRYCGPPQQLFQTG